MKPLLLVVLIMTLLTTQACYRRGILPTATPLPLPTELATTPLPDGIRPGGMEEIFVSAISIDGFEDNRCYKLYRFYADGLVLYADFACFKPLPINEIWTEVNRWFHRENQDVARGDYFVQDHQIWIRIVSYDEVHETVSLRSFQGEYCDSEMVLQEPAIHSFSGIPSNLTDPVLEYSRLQANAEESSPAEACHVAGYRVLYRPSVTLAGGWTEYRIQTDAGGTCSLEYINPDGLSSQAVGTGAIIADAQGLCEWNWEVGEVIGTSKVIVTIDEIRQEYLLELR